MALTEELVVREGGWLKELGIVGELNRYHLTRNHRNELPVLRKLPDG
jgi:hypothetical protein